MWIVKVGRNRRRETKMKFHKWDGIGDVAEFEGNSLVLCWHLDWQLYCENVEARSLDKGRC